MSIGIAAVVIFILYLIDKNQKWKQAAKVGAALLVLGVVGLLALLGYNQYENWRTARQSRADAIHSCLERNGRDTNTRKACEADPEVEVKKNYVICGIDEKGHILSTDTTVNGGCIPPPTEGYTIDPKRNDVFDRAACELRLMKQVNIKDLPDGATLESATKACAQNPNGNWSYNPKNDVWIDISAGLIPKNTK